MSKSFSVTFSRPNLTTVWPFDTFVEATLENVQFQHNTGYITSWIKGNEETDLELTIDHVTSDEGMHLWDIFVEYAPTCVPAWITPANKAEVEAYYLANGIIVNPTVIIDNPDLSAYEPLDENRPAIRAARNV
jgi:hypothetical protein